MARIELRDATIYFQDGLSGTAIIEEAACGVTETDVDINTIVLNSVDTDLVPIGARFTVNTANNVTTYTVTDRYGTNEVQTISINDSETTGSLTLNYAGQVTANIAYDANAATVCTALTDLSTIGANDVSVTGGPGPGTDWIVEFTGDLGELDVDMIVGADVDLGGGNGVITITETTPGAPLQITNITFTPQWGATGTPATSDVITFIAKRIEIKIGEGNVTWTESKEYEYLLDRGDLDTVKEGDEQPLELSLEFVYEYVTTELGEDITPVDALKQGGEASEWVTSATDQCEPYAIDIVIMHCVPCGAVQDAGQT